MLLELLALVALTTPPQPRTPTRGTALPREVEARGDEAVTLRFEELLEETPRQLALSKKVRALAGRRVTLVGWMARMEEAPLGGFWLTPFPVACDEQGGGTADLPPDAVRVVVRSAAGKALDFIPRPLEVTGVLEVGRREDPEGGVSHLRVLLDGPSKHLPAARPAPGSPSASSVSHAVTSGR